MVSGRQGQSPENRAQDYDRSFVVIPVLLSLMCASMKGMAAGIVAFCVAWADSVRDVAAAAEGLADR